jgi:hypothetical protein
MENFVLAAVVMFSTLSFAQGSFVADGDGTQGGSISTHLDQGQGAVINSAISTSTSTGFTSPAVLTHVHLGGKDYVTNPSAGVNNIGSVQFGTGLFLNGDLNSVALFDSANLSYVTVATNGSCGQFKPDDTCKANGMTPNTATAFVGVFVGTISWNTLPDGSHVLAGTVLGIVNNKGNPVYMSFVATTLPGSFSGNGHLRINTVNISSFD